MSDGRVLARLTTVIVTVVLLWVVAGAALASGARQVTLSVEGMVCSGCEATVEAVLADLEGVHAVQADRTTETAAVVYDPAAIEPAAMARAVNVNTYYDASIQDPSAEPAPDASELAAATDSGAGSGLPLVAAALAGLGAATAVWLTLRRRSSKGLTKNHCEADWCLK